jgi:exopolyphosphatase/guanosine-5'-triphosphate,3'-diphosphate pyrophosphatase
MRFAAVDIGSNAIRLQITTLIHYNGKDFFKTLEYLRFPMRLGKEVFATGQISAELELKFVKLLTAFAALIELYEVQDYMVCATSAFRESSNGVEIAERIQKQTGLKIEIIDGDEEANLISNAIKMYVNEKPMLHIDVGGGSTELNLYINSEKVNSASFKIGSVRNLGHFEFPDTWVELEQWIKQNVDKAHQPLTAIGTGGNINKLYELAAVKNKKNRSLNLADLMQIYFELSGMSVEERINKLMLNEDRADVIVPAAYIYIHVMQKARAKKIIIPDVGLKDGIIRHLYERNISKV